MVELELDLGLRQTSGSNCKLHSRALGDPRWAFPLATTVLAQLGRNSTDDFVTLV